ncbi:hypothetical protein BDV26DRAFT_300767 [Aspergillus bertholletiae]|uniref:Zn(2)-C6 fungal-type domain-containing protein n=1 Tax=Aspergillus bertholletiae TaxID=1226010 RepID=A0A5N7BJ60_9EURO|nr:hypothetical protein BDV26DRAFT_300767 [Aspergillus bertholletiae]
MPSQPPSPHVGVIVNLSARRAACVQCHAQRLRCTKPENCMVCVRCQRLNPRTAAEDALARRVSRADHTNAREGRHKRSVSVLETTPEEDSRPDRAREHVRSSPVSTLDQSRPQPIPPAVGIAEVPPPGPPSIADWSMSDIFNFASPRDSSRENPFPSLWTPDSVPPVASWNDYFQMPANGLAGLGTQTRIPDDRSAPSGLDSLQDITRELSTVNLSLFDLEQSLHAEPWGLMFASPAAVITKLSTCGVDQPDDTLALRYPLIDRFKKTQRFIDIARHARVYFASLPTPPASTSTSSSTGRPSSIGEAASWHPSHAWHPDSDTSSQGSSPFSPPVEVYMPRDMPPPYAASASGTTRGDRPGRTANRTASCDVPTALLFTTGYARILDLFMTVLTPMSHFVHALSVHSMTGGPDYRPSMHPVIPPLQWGGFQPANYSALQILMAIQVISSLLTEMALLSPAMIELVAQGERPANRRGKVGLLRRKLRQLKKELEKSMHI